jgi:hypothetical protein
MVEAKYLNNERLKKILEVVMVELRSEPRCFKVSITGDDLIIEWGA